MMHSDSRMSFEDLEIPRGWRSRIFEKQLFRGIYFLKVSAVMHHESRYTVHGMQILGF